jgi:hypothetical protein
VLLDYSLRPLPDQSVQATSFGDQYFGIGAVGVDAGPAAKFHIRNNAGVNERPITVYMLDIRIPC